MFVGFLQRVKLTVGVTKILLRLELSMMMSFKFVFPSHLDIFETTLGFFP